MSFGVSFSPPMGYVRFVSDDPHYEFSVRLGDGVPTVTDGYAGWQIVQRPRRRGLTEWKGNNPLTMTIDIMFDALIQGTSVEDDIRQLEKMAGLDSKIKEPPHIKFHSNGVIPHDEHDASQLEWVIFGVDWGKADRNTSGNRMRQLATVTVCEFVTDDQLSQSPAVKNQAANGSKSKGAKHKTHHVKKGETLSSIAKDELGDSTRWREIGAKNPIHGIPRRDPKHVTVNETLKMP